MKRVVIIGASANPDRYAYMAYTRLRENGYTVIPLHPRLDSVEGTTVVRSLSEIDQPVFAVTLYVRPPIAETYGDDLVALKPEKLIMNPGTESDELERRCGDAGIMVQRACTLVLLASGQFESTS